MRCYWLAQTAVRRGGKHVALWIELAKRQRPRIANLAAEIPELPDLVVQFRSARIPLCIWDGQPKPLDAASVPSACAVRVCISGNQHKTAFSRRPC